jgi:ABC-2 type transport system permease protein
MADGLQAIADVLPLSFAYDALHAVSIDGADLAGVSTEVIVLAAMAGAAIALAALTLRRRTA